MRALSELFTESGVYFVPDSVGRDEKDEKAAMELAAKGPVAIIYYDADGTDYSWTLYVKGLVHFFVTALLLGLLMRSVPASLGGFANGAKFGGMIGLIAALFIQGGNIVWWGMGTSWLLYSFIYDIVVFTVAGGLLGQFMKPSSSAEA